MPARAAGRSAAGRKQVRFARPLLVAEEEEETTLFEAGPERRRGPGRRAEREAGVRLLPARGQSGRCVDTFLVCWAFLGLGMTIAILGPTFQELATNVNRNISDISYIFVGRSLGYAGGSLVGGLLFDCTNPHLLIGISMLMTALGMFAIPWCTKAVLLTALMSLIGISMGFLDTDSKYLQRDFRQRKDDASFSHRLYLQRTRSAENYVSHLLHSSAP